MPPPDEQRPSASADPAADRLWGQEFLTRRVAFPAYCATKSFEAVTRDFRAESLRIESVCGAFSPEQFSRRAELRERFDGDPGSGDWSASMIVEHVVAAGELIARITEMLARDQPTTWEFSCEALRPKGDRGVAVLQEFRNYALNYATLATDELAEASSRRTHEHPQHGPMDLHRWHCFAAIHLRRHRRQLQALRESFDEEARQNRQAASLLEPSPGLHPSP